MGTAILKDRMYVSVSTGTNDIERATHKVDVYWQEPDQYDHRKAQLSMHFNNLYMSMSVDDWKLFSEAVNQALDGPPKLVN